MKNGAKWQDVDGKDIQAHGGCIVRFGELYYWYGEHKGAPNRPGKTEVDVIGVSCYTSRDLVNWKYEGLALEADKDNPESCIHTSKVVERPKVLYCEKTGKYVMWMHLDNWDRTFPAAGVATSDSPKGPFKLERAIFPNHQDSRDMTVYTDDDGRSYLFHSSNRNKTMNISGLNPELTDVDGSCVAVLVDQEREAPAIFKKGGVYYMVSSGCTAWEPNSALYARTEHILGKWKLIDNPCEGENYRKTFFGQSSYIFEVEGKFYLMLDHWKPNDLQSSGYSILPIEVDERTSEITVPWQDEWLGI